MKRCPSCKRTYEDAVRFCIDDGAILQSASMQGIAVSGDATNVGLDQTMAPPTISNDADTDVDMPGSHDHVLKRGDVVGEYVIDKAIGEGGMGIIFAATHPLIGKAVAIKVLNATMSAHSDMVGRFVQEAKSVNQIRHRNIVDIFSFGVLDDGRHYFVMELLDGQSLARRIRESAVPWSEAIQIWQQIASAIEAAHKTGIVHRDLKPDNVFITQTEDGPFVKVLDFGIAKLLDDNPGAITQTSLGIPIGTPQYMAPEQAAGGKVDARADLYALGVIMFETMCGRPPFQRDTVVQLLSDHINTPPPDIRTLVQNVDEPLGALVDRMLAKDPAARPLDMSEVRRELQVMRERANADRTPLFGTSFGEDASRTQATPIARPRRLVSRSRFAAVVGLAAAFGMGAVLVLNKGAQKPPVTAQAEPARPVEPAKPVEPVKPAAPVGPKPGRLVVTTNTPSTRVFLDKSETERSSEPAAAGGSTVRLSVPPDVMWQVRVESVGYKPAILPLRLADGEETALPVVLTKESTGKKEPRQVQTKPAAAPAEAPKADNGKFLDPFSK